ncbi:hypothetical protein [Ochrobactrum sp. RH2CCR150]|uniref:DUF7657 domain-containing protein n=1 Tax=Ochrobactrum sp. RH2CCR150 TaxID=2587044 RepID=UPI0015FBD211|nr:hypothetical protein [Ochrobactrum sp. RH2CCR150]
MSLKRMQALDNDETALKVLTVCVVLVAIIYVLLGLTPSHYSIALQNFGIDSKPLFGKARAIRSDEWAVLTPYFQIAVLGQGGVTDVISPYQESLKAVWPLPILDWSLIFKPQLWGFWVFPPATAFSLYFACLWVSCVLGYTLLARMLGASALISFLGAVALYSSHFTQVWWTSHAATFAFAPWPLVIYLWNINPVKKLLLLYWAIAAWIFSDFYPAFIIPGGFALLILLLVFRRDLVCVKGAFIAIVAMLSAAATVYLYFGEIINIMKATEYPGQRLASGGGVSGSRIIAHILPFFTTTQFATFLPNSNECEVAVVSTLIPLIFLCFVNLGKAIDYVRGNVKNVIIAIIGLSMMFSWMVFPIPAEYGRLLMWTNVPGTRMVWGFGLFLTIYLVVLSSIIGFSFSWLRFSAFCAILIGAWLASKIGFAMTSSVYEVTPLRALKRSWFDWIAIVPFGIIGVLIMSKMRLAKKPEVALFVGATISGLVTFGTFNPLQQAYPIFNLPNSDFLAKLRADAKTNPNGWAVVPGVYGATINGAGIPAINHVLLSPQQKFFKRFFSDLDDTAFNHAFNRYEHVVPKEGLSQPHVPQNDVVLVPLQRFTQSVEKP